MEIKIDNTVSNQRLDKYLLKYFDKATRAQIYKFLRTKKIKLNNNTSKPGDKVNGGDIINVHMEDSFVNSLKSSKDNYTKTNVKLDIIYENADIAVVNKPKGMLSQPSHTRELSLVEYAANMFSDKITDTFTPAPINRLDRNTQGLIIIAKTYSGAKKYSQMLKNHEIKKYYKALVKGRLEKPGEVSGFIDRNVKLKKSKITMIKSPHSKQIHTKYKPISYSNGGSYIEIELITGRTHQIRACMSYLGYPLVGDKKYDKDAKTSDYYLVAYKLVFPNMIVVEI